MSRRRGQNDFNLAEHFGNLRSDYTAAKINRFRRVRTGLLSMGSGADYHYKNTADFLRIMEYARDMDRNDAIVGQMVDRAVINTIQDGIKVDPKTGDTGLDADLASRWAEWSTNPDQCDITGEMSFVDMEYLVLRQTFVDGSILALPNKDTGALQLIEAHRLRTPLNTKRNVVHGILMNNQRRPLEYWLTREDINPLGQIRKVSEIKPFPARDDQGNKQVFHVYNPKRVSQARGVSVFAPIFDMLGMYEDINFSKLVQSQTVSCFTYLIEPELDAVTGGAASFGAKEPENQSDGSTRIIENIGPGLALKVAPGEKVKGFSPNVPNQEFFQHSRMVEQIISINLGLPRAVAFLDGKDTNFSGWRGAADQARMGFRHNQNGMISRFNQPTYEWKVRQWMAEDPDLMTASMRDGVDIFGHRWNPPGWKYIEPKKDADADVVRLENNMISPSLQQRERGRDWDKVYPEIIQDRSKLVVAAIEAADTINQKFPDAKVDWRELAGTAGENSSPMPGGANQNNEPSDDNTSTEGSNNE